MKRMAIDGARRFACILLLPSAIIVAGRTLGISAPLTSQCIDSTNALAAQGDLDGSDGWSLLTLSSAPASELVRANHPVMLLDAVSGRILWQGRAPEAGVLSIPNDHGVATTAPLKLRAHRETVVYAHALGGAVAGMLLDMDGSGGRALQVPRGSCTFLTSSRHQRPLARARTCAVTYGGMTLATVEGEAMMDEVGV